MNRADIEARERRLEELSAGLRKEVSLWKGGDPLLYLERRTYLNAIQDVLLGLEAARTVMARAAERLRKDDGRTTKGEAEEQDELRESA